MHDQTNPSQEPPASEQRKEKPLRSAETEYGDFRSEAAVCFPTFARAGRACLRWCARMFTRRRLVKLAKACLLMLIVLGLAHLAATIYLGARVKSELAKIARRGEILNVMDAAPPPVPDKENAALLLLKAAEILEERDRRFAASQDPGAERRDRYWIDYSDPHQLRLLPAMIMRDADVMRLVQRATSMPKSRFDTHWEALWSGSASLEHYAKIRKVAWFVSAAGVAAALRGDPAEALERARMGFILSRRLLKEPLWIAQLIAYAVDALAVVPVMCVVERGKVPEESARRLAQELAKDDLVMFSAKAIEMERALVIQAFDQLRQNSALLRGLAQCGDGTERCTVPTQLLIGVGLPLIYADELQYLKHMGRTLEAVKKPWRQCDWQTLEEQTRKLPFWALLTRCLAPVFTAATAGRDRAIAMRRMAVTALAIEQYRSQTGHVPPTLLDLKAMVPWATTEDIFSGKDFVYQPRGKTYLLYSIGQDLRDDGGRPCGFQAKRLGRPVRHPYDPYAGDLVWLPQLWRMKSR